MLKHVVVKKRERKKERKKNDGADDFHRVPWIPHPRRFHGRVPPSASEQASRDSVNLSASSGAATSCANTRLLVVEQHFVFIKCQHGITNSSFERATRPTSIFFFSRAILSQKDDPIVGLDSVSLVQCANSSGAAPLHVLRLGAEEASAFAAAARAPPKKTSG